jgi:hypothetical protein
MTGRYLGVQDFDQDFESLDYPRAGPVEVSIAVGQIRTAGANGG